MEIVLVEYHPKRKVRGSLDGSAPQKVGKCLERISRDCRLGRFRLYVNGRAGDCIGYINVAVTGVIFNKRRGRP